MLTLFSSPTNNCPPLSTGMSGGEGPGLRGPGKTWRNATGLFATTRCPGQVFALFAPTAVLITVRSN